jgi:hypothetical protein
VPTDPDQRYNLHGRLSPLVRATLGEVAGWCFENMEPENTVTVFVASDLGGTVDGVATITLTTDGWKVHSSARRKPDWVIDLCELIL